MYLPPPLTYLYIQAPTIERIYRRAVAILWPRALAPLVLAPAGLTGAVHLLEMRLHPGSGSSAAEALHAAGAVSAALDARSPPELVQRTLAVAVRAPREVAEALVLAVMRALHATQGVANDRCVHMVARAAGPLQSWAP